MSDGEHVTLGSLRVGMRGTAGPLVVFLHPLALSRQLWTPLVDAVLDGRARVITVDARGHGESGWDGRPFTIEDMADDVAEVIREAGGGPARVLGKSMGGGTAIALAIRHPELVDRLALVDTTSCYGPDRVERWAERSQAAREVPRAEQVAFQIDRWFTGGFAEQHPEDVQRVVDIFLATDSEVHAVACLAMGAFDARASLGSIRADTLVVVGEEDSATPVAMAQELAGGIPGARLEVLIGARHMSLIERQDTWPRLADYLTGT